MNAQKLIVESCRDTLVPLIIGGQGIEAVPLSIKKMARQAVEMVTKQGSAPSCNMYGLTRAAGHALGMLSDNDLQVWLNGEIACSWYRRKCGVSNEETTRSHGILNAVPIFYAALRGFDSAKLSITRTLRFVREVDAYKTGRCFCTGARTSAVDKADFLDDAAKAVRGDKLRVSKRPGAQDVMYAIQKSLPSVIRDSETAPLPPLRYATFIEVYKHGVVTKVPSAPPRGGNRYGMVALSWYVVAGGKIVSCGDESEPPYSKLGDLVSVIETPTGVID